MASKPGSDRKLRAAEAAKLAGVATGTWHGYVSRGQAPPADGRYDGRTPWWFESTVRQWQGSRPGPGRPPSSRGPRTK